MSRIGDWEHDDVMQDYMQWQDELDRLSNLEEPDEEEIERVTKIIESYKDVL